MTERIYTSMHLNSAHLNSLLRKAAARYLKSQASCLLRLETSGGTMSLLEMRFLAGLGALGAAGRGPVVVVGKVIISRVGEERRQPRVLDGHGLERTTDDPLLKELLCQVTAEGMCIVVVGSNAKAVVLSAPVQ
jgi:hypothetical protein